MRIESLQMINFGPFLNQIIEFNNEDSNVQFLIGKSSSTQKISEAIIWCICDFNPPWGFDRELIKMVNKQVFDRANVEDTIILSASVDFCEKDRFYRFGKTFYIKKISSKSCKEISSEKIFSLLDSSKHVIRRIDNPGCYYNSHGTWFLRLSKFVTQYKEKRERIFFWNLRRGSYNVTVSTSEITYLMYYCTKVVNDFLEGKDKNIAGEMRKYLDYLQSWAEELSENKFMIHEKKIINYYIEIYRDMGYGQLSEKDFYEVFKEMYEDDKWKVYLNYTVLILACREMIYDKWSKDTRMALPLLFVFDFDCFPEKDFKKLYDYLQKRTEQYVILSKPFGSWKSNLP